MIRIIKLQDMITQQEKPAGRFSTWLRYTRNMLVKDEGIDVPCGKCNACCKSSYFIHIRPEETRTLKHIPRKILFSAPGLPKGNVLMGYDENGHCPMLINEKCSIYDHRPLTCRKYDCRIFSAAGIVAGDYDKILITQHIKKWKFSYLSEVDYKQHFAVKAAAMFLKKYANCFPDGVVPSNSTQLAILAIKVYDVFLEYNSNSSKTGCTDPDIEIINAVMKANEKVEASCNKVKGRYPV